MNLHSVHSEGFQNVASLKAAWLYFAVLWGIAFIPLVGLRNVSFSARFLLIGCLSAIWLLVAFLWWRTCSREETSVSTCQLNEVMGLKEAAIAASWMALLTIWQFHLPMMEHWWSATDETLTMAIRDIWYQTWDDMHARPLAGLPFVMASWITPNSFLGFLILNSFFRFGTAFFLYAAFRTVYPANILPAASSAALLIVSPTESIRYLSTALCYYSPMFFMMLACWLYLWSYRHGSCAGLLASLIAVGAALLQYESPLLLLGLVPALVWGWSRPHRWLWVVAWYATCVLFGLRLLHHFLFDANVYQIAIIGPRELDAFAWIERIIDNVLLLMGTIVRYVDIDPATISQYWPTAALSTALAVAPFLIRGKNADSSGLEISWRHLVWSLVALVLIVLPHALIDQSKIKDFAADRSIHLGMFTSVVQVVVIVLAVMLLAARCGRGGKPILAIATAALFFLAVVHNEAFQARGGNWNSYVSFEKTARLYRSLAEKFPKNHGANAFFVIIPDDRPSQFGWAYSLYHGGCSLFGMPGYQGRQLPDGTLEQRFPTGYDDAYANVPECTYIVFRTTDHQEGVDVVSVPPAKERGKVFPCRPCYAGPLSDNSSRLPYFGLDYVFDKGSWSARKPIVR